MSTKTCSSCGVVLPLVEFPRHGGRADGRFELCFPCKRASAKASRDRDLPRERERVARWRDTLRDEVFATYGSACACCGESERDFLSIDHIAGGGRRHRAELGLAGVPFYSWLKQNGWPTGYRVLCFNCNIALGLRGRCPHNNVVESEVVNG